MVERWVEGMVQRKATCWEMRWAWSLEYHLESEWGDMTVHKLEYP